MAGTSFGGDRVTSATVPQTPETKTPAVVPTPSPTPNLPSSIGNDPQKAQQVMALQKLVLANATGYSDPKVLEAITKGLEKHPTTAPSMLAEVIVMAKNNPAVAKMLLENPNGFIEVVKKIGNLELPPDPATQGQYGQLFRNAPRQTPTTPVTQAPSPSPTTPPSIQNVPGVTVTAQNLIAPDTKVNNQFGKPVPVAEVSGLTAGFKRGQVFGVTDGTLNPKSKEVPLSIIEFRQDASGLTPVGAITINDPLGKADDAEAIQSVAPGTSFPLNGKKTTLTDGGFVVFTEGDVTKQKPAEALIVDRKGNVLDRASMAEFSKAAGITGKDGIESGTAVSSKFPVKNAGFVVGTEWPPSLGILNKDLQQVGQPITLKPPADGFHLRELTSIDGQLYGLFTRFNKSDDPSKPATNQFVIQKITVNSQGTAAAQENLVSMTETDDAKLNQGLPTPLTRTSPGSIVDNFEGMIARREGGKLNFYLIADNNNNAKGKQDQRVLKVSVADR